MTFDNTHTVGWGGGGDGKTELTKGIHEATVSIVKTKDGKRTVVLWMDIFTNDDAKAGGGYAEGWRESPDGRKVAWKCEAKDEKTLTVTINGETKDAKDGGLILISTVGGKTRIRQLQRDLSGLDPDIAWRGRMSADPDIVNFFNEAAAAK
jgi:hypothetical protein